MPVKFKIDVIEALKQAGYSSTRIRNEKLIGEGMLQKMRKGEMPSWHILGRLCHMLNMQPGDLLEYEYAEGDMMNDVKRSNSSRSNSKQ